jgi:site-specific recombinase XerD
MPMRISEAIQIYMEARSLKRAPDTMQGYYLSLRHFCLWMRDCELESVTDRDPADWLKLQQQLGWDNNTLINRSTALRQFFTYWNKKNPKVLDPWFIEKPKKYYKLPRIATEDVYRKLLAVIPADKRPINRRNRAIVMLLWDTGARVGEICSLDLKDLEGSHSLTVLNRYGKDLRLYRAVINSEKSRGTKPFRELYWSHKTQIALERWLVSRKKIKGDSEALFVSASHNHYGRRLTADGVGHTLRECSAGAGLPNINAHSFRHHRARSIIEGGGTNSDVMNVLGHASLNSSSIYTMMNDRQLARRVGLTLLASPVDSSYEKQETPQSDPPRRRPQIGGSTKEKIGRKRLQRVYATIGDKRRD